MEIPDAVYLEATRVRAAAGVSRIITWINDRSDRVRIVPTETGVDQQRRLEEGRPLRGLGEQAAMEALDIFLARQDDAQALLLFEDTDVLKRRAIIDERASLISTGDLLRTLEAAHLIQSADRILDEAARSGRNMARQRTSGENADTSDALLEQLQQPRHIAPGKP